jgi:hypothetical protein
VAAAVRLAVPATGIEPNRPSDEKRLLSRRSGPIRPSAASVGLIAGRLAGTVPSTNVSKVLRAIEAVVAYAR